MTVRADHHLGRTGQPTRTTPGHAPKREPEDRGWLILLGAVLLALVVFGAMVGLTMLGGGTDYAPWAP